VKQKTARILVMVSAFPVLMGIIVTDPLGGLFFLVLAGILTLIAAALSSKGLRHIALVLLSIITLAAALWKYPEARRHYQSYRKHVLEQSAEVQKEVGSHNELTRSDIAWPIG
jgi:membrane protein implicated in regulation of membrane protease activity